MSGRTVYNGWPMAKFILAPPCGEVRDLAAVIRVNRIVAACLTS
jgi:hypothetical protein